MTPTILDFLTTRPRSVTASEFRHELIMLEGGPIILHIPQSKLLAIAEYGNYEYRLGFLDLSRTYSVKGVDCGSIEGESMVSAARRDLPWTRLRLSYVLSLVPFECSGALTHPALKVVIPSEWGMFDWARIARIILDDEADRYVDYIARERGWRIERVG